MLGPLLVGRSGVTLAPLTLEENLRALEWMVQPEATYFWWPREGEWTREHAEERYRKSAESPDSVNWAIHVDDAHVGFTGIEHIDWISRQGESYIFVGEHRLYRKGVASEAIRLRTDYAFRELNLHRVYNWAAYENVGSRRANEKAGYRQRVLVPKVMRRGARYLDAWGGDILRSDWEARGGQPDR